MQCLQRFNGEQLGTELGTTNMSPLMQRLGLWTLPILIGGVMTIYPALMQIAFTITALLGLIQAYCFRQPSIRSRLGIHPIPEKPRPKATYKITPLSYKPPTPTVPGSDSEGLGSRLANKVKQLSAGPVRDVKEAASSFNNWFAKARNHYGY